MERKEEIISALERALNASEQCYFAFNNLSVVTKVSFTFAATDLYEARQFLDGWLKKMREGK